MSILGMMVMMMFAALGTAFAVTVNLTDGSSVQGDIIKQDNKSIQLSVDGVTMTYYADEIKDVDGSPFAGQAQPQPVASAPIIPPTEIPPTVVPPTVVAPTVVQPVSNQPGAVAPAPVAGPESAPVEDTIDPDKRALILKFIDVFGTRQALKANFEMMLQQIEKEKPDEAQKIRDRIKVDEIIERLLPIYDRNFTSEDLEAFIAFYGSPEGKKLISTIPELMKESVKESVKYMEEKFPEVNQGQ